MRFLYSIIWLIVTIPIKCFCFLALYSLSLAFLIIIRQSVEKPVTMESWEGFFQPQIQINSNITGGLPAILGTGDCVFIQPTYVKAYNACCDPKTGIEGNSDATCKECICAKRVLFNCKTELYPNPWLGCVPIPLGPPPPPFYDHFQQLPEVKIIPMQDSSFFNPMVKAMIGLGNQKRCSDDTIVDMTNDCADQSEGEVVGYASMVLRLNTDGSSQGKRTLSYANKGYTFEAKERANQICGIYYGSDRSSLEEISSVCYDIPKARKPEIVNYPPNIADLLNSSKAIPVSTYIDGYNKNLPFNLYYHEWGALHNDTSLQLKRLKMGDDHFFESNVICHDALGRSKIGQFINNDIICPQGYDGDMSISYKEDSEGRVLCISEEEKGTGEYLVIRDNKIFNITELGKAFLPNKYSKAQGKWLLDYSIQTSSINIEGTEQTDLDRIKNIGVNLFSIYSRSARSYFTAKYQKLESVTRLGNLPDDMRSLVNTTNLNAEDAKRYAIYDGGSNYIVAKTNFTNDNKAFFLTKEEENNSRYIPLDPHLRGLCITDFPTQDYDNAEEEEFFDAESNKCDFVTLEAWGGGAAGDTPLDQDNLRQYGQSGGSGGYTKGIVKIGYLRNKLKIKVGKGGQNLNEAGEITEIYLCDNNQDNCEILLSANGGQSYGLAADEVNLEDEEAFTKDLVLQVESFPGINGSKETVEKFNPDVPQPTILPNNGKGSLIDWKNTNCYNESVSLTPGMGGCVSRSSELWKPALQGKVRVTCERWRN